MSIVQMHKLKLTLSPRIKLKYLWPLKVKHPTWNFIKSVEVKALQSIKKISTNLPYLISLKFTQKIHIKNFMPILRAKFMNKLTLQGLSQLSNDIQLSKHQRTRWPTWSRSCRQTILWRMITRGSQRLNLSSSKKSINRRYLVQLFRFSLRSRTCIHYS